MAKDPSSAHSKMTPEESAEVSVKPQVNYVKKVKEFIYLYWNQPQEKALVRMLILASVGALAILVFSTLLLWRQTHPSLVVKKEVLPIKKGSEDSHEHVLGASPIPKEILEARKGSMEEGHDLVEPEIENSRELSSLIKDDLKVSLGTRYVDISEIHSNPRSGDRNEGSLEMDLALEVSSLELQEELISRKTEIKALVSSLANARQREELKSVSGMMGLKEDIQRELNLLLARGKVSDVLYTNFNLK